MVCTRCFTFNHAPYIVDAMNGFAMQETTFPVVTVIVDDASTDGEQDVIRKYLDEHFQEPYRTEETDYAHIVCANHRTNPNCQFVVLFLKYNHYSIKKSKQPYIQEWTNTKYIAICEGDDYWTDPKKLQMQVEFLENNSNCGLVHTHVKEFIQKSLSFKEEIGGYDLKDIDMYFVYNPIRTLSVCYRRELSERYNQEIGKCHSWKMGDFPFWIYILMNSSIHFIPKVTGVYRIVNESATHSNNIQKSIDFLYSSLDCHIFMAKYYHKEHLINKIRVENLGWVLDNYKRLNVKPPVFEIIRKYKLSTLHYYKTLLHWQ